MNGSGRPARERPAAGSRALDLLRRLTPLGRWRRPATALLLVALVTGAAGRGQQTGFEPSLGAPAPLVGFSYLYRDVPGQGDPALGLRELLDRLQPDVVRLPVYWPDVEPEPGRLNFSILDGLLAAVAAHDRAAPARRRTSVVLVVGIRNLGYPEAWVPEWAAPTGSADLTAVMSTPAYAAYVRAVVRRYARSRLLLAWQVENEPFDDVSSGHRGSVALPAGAVGDQVRAVRQMDAGHPVVVTTYDSATVSLDRDAMSRWSWLRRRLPVPQPAGHPNLALDVADVLGLDAYVVTPSTPLDQAPARERIDWKMAALAFWAERASAYDKQMWVMEMQAAPWQGIDGFTPEDLLRSARLYSQSGARVVLLWGVETWLEDPVWMDAGQGAIRALRGGLARPASPLPG